MVELGKVQSIEREHKTIQSCKKGQSKGGIAIKIDSQKQVGRHFTERDLLYSRVTRKSIDVLKESFRDDVSTDEWKLVIELKKKLKIK